MDDKVVILKVQLDEAATEKKLQELVLQIEQTKKAQAALTAERKLGTVTDEEFSKQSVALTTQLKGQRGEFSANQKNLELFRTATGELGNTYKGTQAQLSLAQRQFQLLEGSQDNSSESAKELGKTIDGLRNALKATDETQSLFVRNIGNYPKGESLAPLIQQLVRLQEAQKAGALSTEEAAEADAAALGFKQRIAQAGAQEGKSYEQTTALVKEYGDAIRPATAALVALEQEQKQVVVSGKATEQEVAQIGFRFGQAKKSIQEATEALAKVPEEAGEGASETKSLAAGLLEAAKSSDVLGGAVDVLSTAKEKYTVATNLAKAAMAGEVTVLGLLKVALLATGLGALVVILGSVIAFLTKTQVGTDLLSRKMAALGTVARVVTNLFVDLGGKIVAAVDNPKKAFADLVEFLENQVTNRIKSFGVLLEGLKTGSISKIADSFIQFNLGITDATAKAKAFGQEIDAAATSAERLAQMERDLVRAQNDNIATNKTLLNQVERLKNVRDNEFNSIQVRKKANEDAYKVELERERQLTKVTQQQIDVLTKKLELEGGRGRNEELFAELQRANNELKDIQEDAAGKQNELITNRYQLEQEAIDKSIELRSQAFALETALLTRRLAQVQTNSDEELSLLQQKLRVGQQAELNVKNLTLKQKQAIDVKYETDSLALSLDFSRRRLQAALAAQLDLTTAQLAGQRAGSAEALRLQAEQIEQQRTLALAGLAANADNTAKTAAINAQAAQQQRQAEYANATQQLNDYLDQKRQAVELDYAKGITQEGEYQRQLAAVNQAGFAAQAVVNEDYQQDNSENRKQATDAEIEQARRATAATKFEEQTKQEIKEATLQAAIAHTDTIINLFGEESQAGQAALAIKKVLGLAEIALNLQKELAANKLAGAQIAAFIPPPAGPILGTAYVIAKDALAITSAAAGAAAILKLQKGGIADGPSHEQGGIHLYRAGRATGIEIEGGEPVLIRNVSQSPLLLGMASAINQLAGGRALVPNFPQPRMAMGGVAQPLILDQLRGQSVPIDYERQAQATAKALRISPPITRIVDVKDGLSRDAEAQALGNG